MSAGLGADLVAAGAKAAVPVRPPASLTTTAWQRRAKRCGLTQRMLARLLGHAESTVSRQLRGKWESGVPGHVIAAILAWEVMSAAQRRAWLVAVQKDRMANPGDQQAA